MLWLAALFVALPQRFIADTPLQPFTATSPSGEWSLRVDPSSRVGAGKSTIAITKHGVVQWTGEKPFTFREAVVDDSGVSAGYAYSLGLEGSSEDAGALVVALLGPDGRTQLVDETPRRSRSESHMPPHPCAKQLLMHAGLGAVILRLDQPGANDFSECWFAYTLSPPKKLAPIRGEHDLQAADQQVWAFAIVAIRGTPLTLAHWHTPGSFGPGSAGPGSEFALYDEHWKLVWSLPLSGDLQLDDDDEEWALFEEIRDRGAILDASVECRFELRHVKEHARVTYAVARDPAAASGWTVAEVARGPFERRPASEAADLPLLKLALAGSVALDVRPPAPGPVRDIQSFTVDPGGAITFVRGEGAAAAITLVTIDATGAVLRQVAIPPIEPQLEGSRDWHPLGDGQWLMTLSPWMGEDGVSRAWRVDGATGAIGELTAFHGPSVETVVPTSDGGFVMLGTHRLEHTSQAELRRCAVDGATLWSHREFGYGQCENPSDLCSPEDVAVGKEGDVLVLDGQRKLVQYFDARGAYLRSLEFAGSWDTESSYLTRLLVEPSGTFLIGDIHDQKLMRRVRPDGVQIAATTFSRANGGQDVGLPVCVDAKGRLWGHDGRQFLEYGEDGIVREHLGTPADAARLEEVGLVFLDGAGRPALADARTNSLHVFDPAGGRAFTCIPDLEDLGGTSSIDAVVTASDGKTYVQPSSYDDRYLAFGEDGKRIGPVELGGVRVAFDRRTGERWTLACERYEWIRLRRFDAEGKLVFETERRPDGGFFEGVGAVACAPDGSVVVLEMSPDVLAGRPSALCFFGPKGEPLRRIRLPEVDLNYDIQLQVGRRWIVVSSYYDEALLVDREGGTCFRFRPSEEQDHGLWAFGLSPHGAELLALTSSARALLRFTLPK